MPTFLRDLIINNLVINEEAISEINKLFLERISAHNQTTQDDEHKLIAIYIVRFDGRGYRTFSDVEAWDFYKCAKSVERIVIQAESPIGMRTNHMVGGQVEIRLDADRGGSSHIIVGGETKDWVETTFSTFENALNRHRSLSTALIRTHWATLIIQIVGVLTGILIALWLASISAPFIQGIEYPKAVSLAFWLLIYSNLWTYLQKQAIDAIYTIFPNVRFNRSSDHWAQVILRKGIETASIALFLWALAWLTKWASSVVSPLLTGNTQL